MKVVTAAEMREIEARAEAAGVPTDELMEQAGHSVARIVRDRCWRDQLRVLVLVGRGNNGGDGLVAARHLHDWGARVQLYLWNRDVSRDRNFGLTQDRGIPALAAEDDANQHALRALLAWSDLVLDAVLGTGRARPIEGLLKQVLLLVRAARHGHHPPTVVAVDLPTGLDADTGEVDPAGLPADLTVTLGFPKGGLLRFPGAEHTGRLVVGEIGLPPGVGETIPVEVATAREVAGLLPSRPASAHKGTFGRALVVGGSAHYTGAPALAAGAAQRAGAGLVTLALARSLQMAVGAHVAEATYLPLVEEGPGVPGPAAADVVLGELARFDAVLIGPGLGLHPATLAFVERVLRRLPEGFPTVVDADALNCLARLANWPGWLRARALLTPHAGEMARLLGASGQWAVGGDGRPAGDSEPTAPDPQRIDAEKLAVARATAAEWRQVVALKGAFAVVADPAGRASINPAATALLATAGTGDVFAGLAVGLLAQGLGPFEAAVAGLFLQAAAARRFAAEVSPAGLVASDLLRRLPGAIAGLATADPAEIVPAVRVGSRQ